MKVYALTGGIAAGKSEASKRFGQRGIPVIDADTVAHEVIAPGGVAEAAVIEAFGENVLSCGKIDREKLGAIVFDDEDARLRLNGLVHPAVREDIARRLAELMGQDYRAAIVDAALHAENGELPPGFETLIVVDCPVQERVRRMTENRGMTEKEAMGRINSQTPPEKKIPLARWVIQNDQDIAHLHAQVDTIAKEILAHAD